MTPPSIYLPNGNPNPGPKFAYKLARLERLIAHAAGLMAAGVPVILAGDFNVVPTEADIYQPNSWKGDALVDPEARAAFARLLGQGWTDALRSIHPTGPLWTFWAYLRQRWPNDKGLRLDHLLLSPDLAPRLKDAGVDRWVRGEAGPSDHAPAWVVLGQAADAGGGGERRQWRADRIWDGESSSPGRNVWLDNVEKIEAALGRTAADLLS